MVSLKERKISLSHPIHLFSPVLAIHLSSPTPKKKLKIFAASTSIFPLPAQQARSSPNPWDLRLWCLTFSAPSLPTPILQISSSSSPASAPFPTGLCLQAGKESPFSKDYSERNKKLASQCGKSYRRCSKSFQMGTWVQKSSYFHEPTMMEKDLRQLFSLCGVRIHLSAVLRSDWVSLLRQSLLRLSAVKQSFDRETVGRKEIKNPTDYSHIALWVLFFCIIFYLWVLFLTKRILYIISVKNQMNTVHS